MSKWMGAKPACANIFNCPAGAPFLASVARAILAGDLPVEGGAAPSPLDLSQYILYLPTRRACLAMRHALLRASPGGAVLMPRIHPLGETGDDAPSLISPRDGEGIEAGRQARAVDPLERRLVLTTLVLEWMSKLQAGAVSPFADESLFVKASPAAASELARELIHFLDEAQAEAIEPGRLQTLAPGRFASHWALTLDFLKIVMEAWPRYLQHGGLADPVICRNVRMAETARRLMEHGSQSPVIIAGSTGSIPSTAGLMQAVLSLDNGAVVLPGLDAGLDEASWQRLGTAHPEHPQFGLRQLLKRLELARGVVRPLPGAGVPGELAVRQTLLREALRSGDNGKGWLEAATGIAGEVESALRRVSLIEAPTQGDEAAVIALILREAAETTGRTASLVTPDGQLAARVSVLLEKWGLAVSHSGGERLLNTRPGIFLQLVLSALQSGPGIGLLSLLKHPATRLALPPGRAARAAELLDLTLFREPGAGLSLTELPRALKRARRNGWELRHRSQQAITPEDWSLMEDAAGKVVRAFKPLLMLAGAPPQPLYRHAQAHLETAQALSQGETAQTPQIWRGDAGAAALKLMQAFSDGNLPGPQLAAQDYPALFRSLVFGETTGQSYAGSRLSICGPLEARLEHFDTVILAGLNEGCWPQAADPGPWLNRSMRASLGLPPPERRTGQSAHDFCQAFGASSVYLTRPLKVDGTPQIASRWLQRLQTLLEGIGRGDALKPEQPWLEWARQTFDAAKRETIDAPMPVPPVTARPRRLSVTAVSTLMANPYAIYAGHILQLEPLPPVCAGPDARERGRIIHDALNEFTRRYPERLPQDIAAALMAAADDVMARTLMHTAMRAFWRPRLARFAAWFAESEPLRRNGAVAIATEIPGRLSFMAPAGEFTLTARADRIDMLEGGALALYDYKSGAMPSLSDVAEGRAPQLPLEARIAIQGGFEGLSGTRIHKLAYISAKGGEPAGVEQDVSGADPHQLAGDAWRGLQSLIARFDQETTPYAALRRPAFAAVYRYDSFAHLARVAEWSSADQDDD